MSKTVSNENGRDAAPDPESTGATQTWGKEVKSYVSTQHGVREGMEVTQSRSSTLFLPQRAFSPVSVTLSQLWQGIQVPSRQLNVRVEHFREVNSWPFPVDPVKPGHTEEFLRMQETALTTGTHYECDPLPKSIWNDHTTCEQLSPTFTWPSSPARHHTSHWRSSPGKQGRAPSMTFMKRHSKPSSSCPIRETPISQSSQSKWNWKCLQSLFKKQTNYKWLRLTFKILLSATIPQPCFTPEDVCSYYWKIKYTYTFYLSNISRWQLYYLEVVVYVVLIHLVP